MNNDNLKKLLSEYEKKREIEKSAANLRKENIYSANHRLSEIDLEISKCSIAMSKILLANNSKELLANLKKQILNLKQEKDNILKQLNIDESYFQPIYECPICNDTGYIFNKNKSSMCNCLKQRLYDLEYNSLNLYSMKNETFNNFNYNVYSDIENKTEYNSNISPRKNIKIIRDICDNFINKFDDPLEKNLLFSGKPGLGKTFLSNCIANELIKKGKIVLYQTAPIMLDSIINYRLRKSRQQL